MSLGEKQRQIGVSGKSQVKHSALPFILIFMIAYTCSDVNLTSGSVLFVSRN